VLTPYSFGLQSKGEECTPFANQRGKGKGERGAERKAKSKKKYLLFLHRF